MAKIVQITQYEANDGSLFLTEAECNAHDFKLENGAKITAAVEAFLNTGKHADRSRSIKGNVAEDFLAFYIPWVEAGSPEVERTVFDTVKVETEAVADAAAQVAADVAPETDGESADPVF